jgi:hypothetical protein
VVSNVSLNCCAYIFIILLLLHPEDEEATILRITETTHPLTDHRIPADMSLQLLPFLQCRGEVPSSMSFISKKISENFESSKQLDLEV